MFFPDTCMRGSLLIPALRAAHLLTGTPDGHSHPVFGVFLRAGALGAQGSLK